MTSVNQLSKPGTGSAPAGAPTRPARRTPTKRRTPLKTSARCVTAVLIALVFVGPYLLMLVSSFKSQFDILDVPPSYLPKGWHPENYRTMWTASQTPLLHNLISTLVIASSATALMVVVCIPAAYYTARFRYPGRHVFLFLVVVTQMLQPTLLATGLFQEFGSLGLSDTWLAMILVNSAANVAFGIWILHNSFAAVPKEINEAAEMDGAGKLTALLRVNLPLVWPGVVTAVIFAFVASANEFSASLVILTSENRQPLSVALSKFVGEYDASWQYLFGVSLVAIIPCVLLFVLVEKRLAGGLTAGSVR